MPANYVLLEKIKVGATPVASVTFSGIPQTGYTDLYIAFSPHTDRASYANQDMALSINGSTANITSRSIYSLPTNTANTVSGMQALFQGGNDALTANQSLVFGPTTIYIPNYTSSSFKSMSCEFTAEGNTTDQEQARIGYSGILWSNTAAITSITIGISGNFVQGSSFYLYGIAKLGTTPAIVPYATGGDTIMTDGTYWYHAFKASGTFTPRKALSCDVLVVAGGGSGGSDVSGGGGAGGVIAFASQSVSTAQTVTIGAGGAGNVGKAESGTAGANSQFGSLTAAVGGGRGTAVQSAAGGSGGGTRVAGGVATVGQGNTGGGGSNSAPHYPAGGGGGAGGVGGSGVTSTGGAGGAGTNSVTNWGALSSALTSTGLGVSGYIAGGGGAASYTTAGAAGSGGATAGLTGGTTSNATANTGSGSGGTTDSGGGTGSGGSGLVIVRYAV